MENPYRYNDCCRTCMGFLDISRNLCDGSYNNLLQMLRSILGFQMNEEIFKICARCEATLNSILEFKDLCLRTIENFNNIHCKVPKQEPIDIVEHTVSESFTFNNSKDIKSLIENDSLIYPPPDAQTKTEITLDSLNETNAFYSEVERSHSENNSLDNAQTIIIKAEMIISSAKQINDSEKESMIITDERFNQGCSSSNKHFRLPQIANKEVFEEIGRCRDLLNTPEHLTCPVCGHICTNIKELSCHINAAHRNFAKSWCYQCNVVTDDLLKHRESTRCLDFFCKYCNEFCGHIIHSAQHLRSHCLNDVIMSNGSSGKTSKASLNITENAKNNLLPAKSREKYEITYRNFMDWRLKNNVKSFSENVLLRYFEELSNKMKPSSLWAMYSMLRATININHNNVNIAAYPKLLALLKRKADGFESKKSKVLNSEEINNFLHNAADSEYLLMKVVLIIGVNGACRKQELRSMKPEHVEDTGKSLIIRIPNPKIKTQQRSFVISEAFYPTCKKYMNLRPQGKNSKFLPFFLKYANQKCTKQCVGLNTFCSIPRRIAEYLGLPDAKQYTGHCFRRSSATILGDAGGDLLALKKRKLQTQ